MSNNFRYDEKFTAMEDVPLEIAEADPEYLAILRKDVLRRAFYSVADKSLCENGVNIKTVTHEYRTDIYTGRALRIGAIVLLQYPVEHVVKMDKPNLNWIESSWNCVWCGARAPRDDKFHSGTCENCGGPKI